ncbi:hypothetical protein ACFWN7_11350 [Agromyces sp. NPDC058484]|uniref:hypothetical protein n=1 Tax=Agromyces sp. NPDC058484 TaxID=3346524 RepID=UPI003663D2C5
MTLRASTHSRIATARKILAIHASFALIDKGAYDNHIWQAVPTVPGRSYVVSADVMVGVTDGFVPSAVFLTAKGMNPDGSGPFHVDAKTVVSVRATDEAGNVSEVRSFTRKDLG